MIKKAESGEDHTPWRWPGGRGDGATREKWALEDETGELRGQEVSSYLSSQSQDSEKHFKEKYQLISHPTKQKDLSSQNFTINALFSIMLTFIFPPYHVMKLIVSQDVSFRGGAECGQSLVEWGMELRTWLPPSCPSSLISSLSLSPLWPVEIIRNTSSGQVYCSTSHGRMTQSSKIDPLDEKLKFSK